MANRENEIDTAIVNRLVNGKGDASYFFHIAHVSTLWNNVNMVRARSAYIKLTEELGKYSFFSYIVYVGIEANQLDIDPDKGERLVNTLPQGFYLHDKEGGKIYGTKGVIQVCHSIIPLNRKMDKKLKWHVYMAFVPQNKIIPATKPKIKITRGTFTDPRDGKVYKTVKIGEQVWLAENLNYEIEGSLCYDNDTANAKKYGRLYYWDMAMKACPPGWHLPSKKEWLVLVKKAVDESGNEGEGKYLKAKSGWNDYKGKSGNGTDEFGFSALPGGNGCDPYYDGVGENGDWWGSSEDAKNEVYIIRIQFNSIHAYWGYYSKRNLCSVRCVKDNVKKRGGKNGKNNKTR